MKHGPKIGLLICLLSTIVTICGIGAGCNAIRWGNEANEVVYPETRPLALLKK